MHFCSQLFEDLAKKYDYGIRCLNIKIFRMLVRIRLYRSDVNTLGSKTPTFFFFFWIGKIYPLYIWYFLVNCYSFSKTLKPLHQFKWLLFSPHPPKYSAVMSCTTQPAPFFSVVSKVFYHSLQRVGACQISL